MEELSNRMQEPVNLNVATREPVSYTHLTLQPEMQQKRDSGTARYHSPSFRSTCLRRAVGCIDVYKRQVNDS